MANEVGTIGLKFMVGDGASPEVFTTVGGVTSIPDVGGGDADKIDITELQDLQRRFLKGYKTASDVTLPINVQAGSTEQAQLKADDDSASPVVRNYKVTSNDGNTDYITFPAYVNGMSLSAAGGDKMAGSVTLVLDATPEFPVLD